MANRTDDASVTGHEDVDGYVFAADDETPGHVTACLSTTAIFPVNGPVDSGTVDPGQLRIPLGEGERGGEYRVAIQHVQPYAVETDVRTGVTPTDGELRLPVPEFDRELDAVLVFATAEDGDFGAAFAEHTFEPEPNQETENGEIVSFHYGNFGHSSGDLQLDEGMAGQAHSIAASPWFTDGPVEYTVELLKDYPTGTELEITLDVSTGGGRGSGGYDLYWDGEPLVEGQPTGEPTVDVTVDETLDLSAGEHTLDLRNYDTRVRIGAMQIEAVGGTTPRNETEATETGGADGPAAQATAADSPGFGALATLAGGALAGRALARQLETDTE
jgi:hypothetical protein